MQKYIENVMNYWQYKVFAGLWASLWSDELPILFLMFVALELLDIYSRWMALTYDWFKKTYPRTPCGLWRCMTWMWQARKWRWIKSTGLREGFCDKMLTYLLLLLVATLVDGAMHVGHMPRVLLSIVVTVLATTEGLSIMENLSECGVKTISVIKEKFVKKLG